MARAVILALEYHLPARIVTNDELAAEFPEWGAAKIAGEKTGIQRRHIAAVDELSSDLAYAAAMKLFGSGAVAPSEVDFVLFCTQTPDFALPTSACLLQHRLGIPSTAGALDFNLGCSGYIYGLSLAKGLIESEQARRVLLLTAETYSKLVDPKDKTVRTIFGDAGAATLMVGDESASEDSLGPIVFGTDGSGGANFVCHHGGMRGAVAEAAGRDALWMNGPEIFNFTLMTVPNVVNRVLARAQLTQDDIDLFVFHQANRYMLEYLRKKLRVPEAKFVIELENFRNAVSCTIPIALRELQKKGALRSGQKLLLVGFGVGYSWGAAVVRWR